MTNPPFMRLGAFLFATGHHISAWRSPDASSRNGFDIADYVALAQSLEAAKFDLLFLEDGAGIREPDLDLASQTARSAHFEPMTLLSALATVTKRIGLVGTVSTSYNFPYHVARAFASMDHLSRGRMGWNLVTSTSDLEAQNFSRARQLTHAERYARAEEFVDLTRKLWDSWAPDGLVLNRATGQYFDPAGVHDANHRGTYFSVKGALNTIRSPQGQPVVVQAGSSDAGMDLAARSAEVVFTAAQTLEDGQSFYRRLKERLPTFGRRPEDLLIMPGIFPVVGRTRAEAEDKYAALQDLTPDAVALALLSQHLGVPTLRDMDPEGPVPDTLLPTDGNKSRQALLVNLARAEGLTLRALALRVSGARGHWQVIGTAEDIADRLEERFRGEAADGFNIMPPTLPGGLDDFIRHVLPELRRRGLARNDYSGATLRENLGLRLPQGKHSV